MITKQPLNLYIPMQIVNRVGLFLILVGLLPIRAHAQSVYEKGGNIFFKDAHYQETQLTALERDSEPSLSPNGKLAVFVRTTTKQPIDTGNGESAWTELWTTNIATQKAEKIVDSKASDQMQKVLAGFSSPQFSANAKSVFFLSQAWVTSAAVHRVDLQTKQVQFVTAGNDLVVIRQGQYLGYLQINQHRYHKNRGSYDCDYIFNTAGKEVKIIQDSCD